MQEPWKRGVWLVEVSGLSIRSYCAQAQIRGRSAGSVILAASFTLLGPVIGGLYMVGLVYAQKPPHEHEDPANHGFGIPLALGRRRM